MSDKPYITTEEKLDKVVEKELSNNWNNLSFEEQIQSVVKLTNESAIQKEVVDIVERRRIAQRIKEEERKKKLEEDRTHISPREDVEHVIRLYTKELFPITKIANIYDSSEPVIRSILKKEGVRIRSRNEAQKLRREQAGEQTGRKKERKLSNANAARQDADTICCLYKEGITVQKLTKDYNCSEAIIKEILLDNNIPIRGNMEAQKLRRMQNEGSAKAYEDQGIICNLYVDQFKPLSYIAEKYKTQPNVIRDILIENGVTLRTQKEAQQIRRQKGD